MKASLCIAIGCVGLFLSYAVFADCGGGGCGGGGCGSGYSSCNAGYPTCDCTDPACDPFARNNCLTQGECCEAFGNIGAR